MKISERIEGTIENWRIKFGEILRGWMASWLSWGLELLLDLVGKAFAPKLKPFVEMLEATGKVSPELKPLLDEIKTPTGEVGAMLSQSAGSALVGGALGKIIDAIFLPISYVINKQTQNVMLTLDQYLAAWLRKKVTPEYLKEAMYATGLPDSDHEILKDLAQIRLDPMSVITAWRRDPVKYEKYFDDLKHQGWTDDRIEALKFFTLFVPSAAEQTLWLAREVYEPDMVRKYGLHDEMPNYEDTDFDKIGVSPEQMINIWGAHWEHASWMQIIEMLHRGEIEESDVWEWFKLVEITPYWRDLLIKIAYTWPTRVDVRRFWDMRTIDEARLRKLYEGMGYRGENLEDYIKWTKVYTDFPMMIARFTKGWITEKEIFDWLIAQGIPEERAKHFIEEKVKPEKPAQVEDDRLATATEIMKGVKKEYISWSQGVEMLSDLGSDEETASFKLTGYGAVIEGSPETYPEFKQMTQAYRKAMGLSAVEVPEEIIKASKEVAEAKEALRQVETKERTDITEAQAQIKLTDAEYRYRQLLIKWEESKKLGP